MVSALKTVPDPSFKSKFFNQLNLTKMKKILIALSIGFISFAALSNSANAQNSNDPVAFNDSKSFNGVCPLSGRTGKSG